MKNHFIKSIFIILVFAFLFTGKVFAFGCAQDAFKELRERLNGVPDFDSKLSAAAQNLSVYAHPRWSHVGNEVADIQIQAWLDLDESFARAALKSVDSVGDSFPLGRLSASEYADVLTLQRVLDSSVSFDDMGDGLGLMAKRIPLDVSDQKIADILKKNKAVFDNPNRPYLAAGYGEAEMLADAKFLLDGDDAIVATKYFRNDLPSGSAGKPYELRVAAARKNNGENVTTLAADAELGRMHGADVLTDQAAYNVGLTTDTIKGKLDSPEKIETIAQAIIEADADPGVPYRFCVSGGNASDVANEFQSLNQKLSDLGSSIQLNVSTDIVFESL